MRIRDRPVSRLTRMPMPLTVASICSAIRENKNNQETLLTPDHKPLSSRVVAVSEEHEREITMIRVNGYCLRAYCFLAHGQRFETWLPAGHYENRGEVWLSTEENIRAIMLHGLDDKNKGTWYIHPNGMNHAGLVTLS